MNKALLFWLGFSCLSVACSDADPGSQETPSASSSSPSVSAPEADAHDRVALPPYVPDSGNMLLRCGRLIDGITDDVTADTAVLIQDGRIRSIGKDLDAPDSTPRMALPEHTCMPGLIDMHTHIMEEFDKPLFDFYQRSAETTLEAGRSFAQTTLMAGFTTVRNLGVYHGGISLVLRDEIKRGGAIGPRMQAAAFYLSIPAGGGDIVIPGVPEESIPGHLRQGIARGADEFRMKAQAAVDAGAGVLKIIASGAVLAHGSVPGAPEMTPEEIAAVVEVAQAAGIPVTAHAHGAQSIKDAILAGVNSIEHASLADEAAIRLAAERDVALSMDIFNGDWIAVEYRRQNKPEEFLRKNDATTLAQRRAFARAHEAGVDLVYGTDAGVYPHGLNANQFRYMVDWGMSEMEAIQAATSVAARVMRWQDRVGALKPGLFGDIIAVRGNPLEDIGRLANVDTVIKGGLLFKAPSLQ